MAQSLLAALRQRKRIDGIADYHSGEPFAPGAGIAVYEPDFYQPYQTLIGPATAVGNAPSPFQPPQVYVRNPMGIVTGLRTPLGDFEQSGLMEF